MGKHFISICIPTYKRTDLLKKLLDSIVTQSFQDIEIIVNDDCPDDSVAILVNSYISSLPIQYEKNVSRVNAVQSGIKVMRRARSPWVKVMHDDDWFATDDALEKFANAASSSGKDFIFSACNHVYLDSGRVEKNNLSKVHSAMLQDSVESLFYLNVIGHPSVVMYKNDPAIEYDPSFNWVLDIDFYMRYLNNHNGFHYIDERLVNIGKGDTQESYKYYKNATVEIPEYFHLLSKYKSSLSLENEYVFWLVWNMVRRFKIKNQNDVRTLGYEGPMPAAFEKILACQKNIPSIILKQTPWSKALMQRCFRG